MTIYKYQAKTANVEGLKKEVWGEMKMAYEQNKLKNQLQVILNYGEVDGKNKRRTKTYGDVNLDETVSTPEALIETGKAMGQLMTPLVESCNNVITYVNVEIA